MPIRKVLGKPGSCGLTVLKVFEEEYHGVLRDPVKQQKNATELGNVNWWLFKDASAGSG